MPLPAVTAVLLGLAGLIIGSFLAAVSVRLPREEDVVAGRSRCMSCRQPLKPWQMVPVFSWLILRGRCGQCGAGISGRYILIELAAGGVGVWGALNGQSWLMIGATALLGWQLLLIAIIDAENFWLPDVLTMPLIGTGLIASGLLAGGLPWNQIVGAVAGFGLLWLLAWLYRRVRGREGLGGGDPILFGATGAWVGWTGLPSVLLWASVVGLSLVLARLLLRHSVRGADRMPFGTFLAIGAWLTWLYGPLGL
ncbi:prepilin peptidase [Brevundimonas goettingensis]|uniref:Prepilin leader peptidase/N-methyltransferase n=1 Tax=Brevundimonas goettingensis TaxID=2774190 RepID=A0A975GYX6_9CAUL|nr:A24 family peptidase [Brevundimonas goettingensis]QTC92065.1 prepilin peptidase [Brevundimonas goettingensis]